MIRVAVAALAFFVASPFAIAQDAAGAWRGTWHDTKNGHQGPLKATITRCDDGRYSAVFTGRFFGVIPFRFHATLTVVGQEGDALLLSGTSNLGALYGTMSYRARVTADCFTADFCSPRYQGRFVMQRDCPSCGHR